MQLWAPYVCMYVWSASLRVLKLWNQIWYVRFWILGWGKEDIRNAPRYDCTHVIVGIWRMGSKYGGTLRVILLGGVQTRRVRPRTIYPFFLPTKTKKQLKMKKTKNNTETNNLAQSCRPSYSWLHHWSLRLRPTDDDHSDSNPQATVTPTPTHRRRSLRLRTVICAKASVVVGIWMIRTGTMGFRGQVGF